MTASTTATETEKPKRTCPECDGDKSMPALMRLAEAVFAKSRPTTPHERRIFNQAIRKFLHKRHRRGGR